MKSAGIYLLLGITAILSVAVQSTQGGSCNACNCQFNNVEVLTQLIRAEIGSLVTNSSASESYFISLYSPDYSYLFTTNWTCSDIQVVLE